MTKDERRQRYQRKQKPSQYPDDIVDGLRKVNKPRAMRYENTRRLESKSNAMDTRSTYAYD
jgi:hypothetical protein